MQQSICGLTGEELEILQNSGLIFKACFLHFFSHDEVLEETPC